MGARTEEAAARAERARAIGLFRYGLIREAADPGLSTRARGRLVRAVAAAEHLDPTGRRVRVSRDTLDRWIRAWRRGGFDALVPSPRQSSPRLPVEVVEMAVALKRENPARTGAQVRRILRTQMGWAPGERTLQRWFADDPTLADLVAAGAAGPVFGRFEAARPNELWTGDALHGPHVGGRKTYLFAFLDDHSRAIMGHRFGFAEDTVRLAAALRPALGSRGVPDGIYVDNGSAFVDAWLLRACAKLGIRLIHSTPGRPQGRGKIERYFRTVREQFLVEITGEPRRATRAGIRSPTWTSSTGCSPPGSRPSTTARSTPRPARPRSRAGTPAARSRSRAPTRWPRRSSGRNSAPSPRPRWCPCKATPTRSTRCWSGAASSWCSTRSTSPASRSGSAASRPAPRSRTASAATPTSKPDPKPHPTRRHRPGSTTPA